MKLVGVILGPFSAPCIFYYYSYLYFLPYQFFGFSVRLRHPPNAYLNLILADKISISRKKLLILLVFISFLAIKILSLNF
ncbi:MAG: hypothetical protein BGO77_08050 [Caedibacter sp. 37-49]|nr:MAG: hypothetical protein BGO77_08050 [Caedibacter sp. 37-49]